jgi:hypothetical protein
MKKKRKSISTGMIPMLPDGDYFAASDAARQAIDNHPNISELRQGLTKALDGTIKRYFSHKPLLKKRRRGK